MFKCLIFTLLVLTVNAELRATDEERQAVHREAQTFTCLDHDIRVMVEMTIDSMIEPNLPLRPGQTQEPNRMAVFGKRLQNELTLGHTFCNAYARITSTLLLIWRRDRNPVPETESREYCERTLAMSPDPYVRHIADPKRRFTPPSDRLRRCLETGMFAAYGMSLSKFENKK